MDKAVSMDVSASLGESVCRALRKQVEKIGLSIGAEPVWHDAKMGTAVDAYTQQVSVTATWRGGERYGTATFFPDGRVFAEYQVLLPHPSQPEHYVESVQVWGPPERLCGDAVVARYQ